LAAGGNAGIVHFLESHFGELEQLRLVSLLAGIGKGAVHVDGVPPVGGAVRVDDEGGEPIASGGVASCFPTFVSDDVENSGGDAGAVVQLAVSVLDSGIAVYRAMEIVSSLSDDQRVSF
jgi:hypothetical protein